MGITKYLPIHLPTIHLSTNPSVIKSTRGAKRVLQERADRQTRKKVMVGSLAVFCVLSLLQAKTNLLSRVRTELVSVVRSVALMVGVIYLLEIARNYFLPQTVTLYDGYLHKIDKQTLAKVKQYVTDLRFEGSYSNIESYAEGYTALKRVSFYVEYDLKKDTLNEKAIKFLKGKELDVVYSGLIEEKNDFSWIEKFPPLKKLSLQHTQFSDEDMKFLEKHKKSLEILDLSGAQVKKIQGLKDFSNLKRLQVSEFCDSVGNLPASIEVFSYSVFLDCIDLKFLKKLPKLRVICTDIHNDKVVTKFEKQVPGVKIVEQHKFSHSWI